jgi:hypothetical protein
MLIGHFSVDEHHLIPKSYGGKEKIPLHRICHQKIHSLFKESELKNYYHTWERILEHPDIQKFVSWVKKRPIEFIDSSKQHNRRKY